MLVDGFSFRPLGLHLHEIFFLGHLYSINCLATRVHRHVRVLIQALLAHGIELIPETTHVLEFEVLEHQFGPLQGPIQHAVSLELQHLGALAVEAIEHLTDSHGLGTEA